MFEPSRLNTSLPESITSFGRLLRAGGVKVGTAEIINAIEAVELVGVAEKDLFKWALQGTLITKHESVPFFDWAFDIFWQDPGRTGKAAVLLKKLAARKALTGTRSAPTARQPHTTARASAKGWGKPSDRDDGSGVSHTGAYSADESLKQKHFEQFTEDDMRMAVEFLKQAKFNSGMRSSRRYTPGHRQIRLDLQKTIRKNALQNRDFIKLAWKQRKLKPRPVVILSDISGSMERYSRILLHFMHTLSRQIKTMEAFTFGTRLTRITHQIRSGDIEVAMGRISADVKDWNGGTRMGAALETFNRFWARRTLGNGAIVILISDGWDTGNNELLKSEMGRLQRSCHRLIWLNPNIGYDTFEPLTRGVLTLLPFADEFLPVHNLQSLLDLSRVLAGIGSSNARAKGILPHSDNFGAYS